MTCPPQKTYENLKVMAAFWSFVDVDIRDDVLLILTAQARIHTPRHA